MKQHLQYHWWKYLLAAILPLILWYSLFSLLLKPARNAQLRILFVGEGIHTQALEEDLAQALPSLSCQTLEEITVTQSLPSAVSYHEFLTARNFDYDILILTESYMRESIGQNFFSRLPQSLSALFPDTARYTEVIEGTDLAYALIPSEGARFGTFYTGSERCYLFFSPESVNLGPANKNGITADDAAVKAAQYLLEVTP